MAELIVKVKHPGLNARTLFLMLDVFQIDLARLIVSFIQVSQDFGNEHRSLLSSEVIYIVLIEAPFVYLSQASIPLLPCRQQDEMLAGRRYQKGSRPFVQIWGPGRFDRLRRRRRVLGARGGTSGGESPSTVERLGGGKRCSEGLEVL